MRLPNPRRWQRRQSEHRDAWCGWLRSLDSGSSTREDRSYRRVHLESEEGKNEKMIENVWNRIVRFLAVRREASGYRLQSRRLLRTDALAPRLFREELRVPRLPCALGEFRRTKFADHNLLLNPRIVGFAEHITSNWPRTSCLCAKINNAIKFISKMLYTVHIS